jgi:hypothetical protein
MLSYTTRRNLYAEFVRSNDSSVLMTGDLVMNSHERMLMAKKPFWFLLNDFDDTTVASQQFYFLPYNCRKLLKLTVTVGTTLYTPKEITNRDEWDRLNDSTTIESDSPSYYYVYRNKVGIYPTPSTAGNTITMTYEEKFKDLSVADYTTGNISAITNGQKTVTGSGTSWTSQMAGRWLRITDGDDSGAGDGYWYKIASVASGTSLSLLLPYQGTTIAGGSASYTIGQTSLLPEEYEMMPVYHAARVYWASENKQIERANMFKELYADAFALFDADQGNQTSSVVIHDSGSLSQLNPNLFIRR